VRVLVVEDDVEVRQAIAEYLRGAGHSVDIAADLARAELLLFETTYDVVVLDQSLPDGDAMEFLRRRQEARWDEQWEARWGIPVLVLISSGLDKDRAAAMRYLGDYLDVPFRPAELLARLDSLTRRRSISEPPLWRIGEPPVLRIGELEIDRERRKVRRGGTPVPLNAREFAVLELLADRLGQPVTRMELMDYALDAMTIPASNVMDTTIRMLQLKLGAPELVQPVRGFGYRLLVGDASAVDQESSPEPVTSPNGGGVLVSQATYSVTIYLGDEAAHEQVQAAVEELVRTAGWEITDRDEPVLGSWFRRFGARTRAAASSDLARDAAATAAHALESRLVLAQDATVTATMMQNLGPVLGALQPTRDAVIRVGALLIVKVDWIVAVHQLTAAQQLMLDHQPQLLTSPHDILATLHLPAADTAAASPSHEPEHSNRPTGPS
jgi:DNA-binding response OmpR family regulator